MSSRNRILNAPAGNTPGTNAAEAARAAMRSGNSEWLSGATSRHLGPTPATRLRSAWRFKSSHPHPRSTRGDGREAARRFRAGPAVAPLSGLGELAADHAGRAVELARLRDDRVGSGERDAERVEPRDLLVGDEGSA